MPFETLKHRFVELAEDAFWDGQEAENEFKVKCDALKHRFFDFTQVAFWVGQEEVYEPPDDCRPLETLLSRHHQGRILGLSIGRK